MNAAHSSEMSVYVYQTIRHHIPKEYKLHSHCRTDIKSHKFGTNLSCVWKPTHCGREKLKIDKEELINKQYSSVSKNKIKMQL
jgi:hypothetical protein